MKAEWWMQPSMGSFLYRCRRLEINIAKSRPTAPGRKVPEGIDMLQPVFSPPPQLPMESLTQNVDECLNLSITLPKERQGDKLLPVFFNIVGGGNSRVPAGIALFG
jgi:hypothetical protein